MHTDKLKFVNIPSLISIKLKSIQILYIFTHDHLRPNYSSIFVILIRLKDFLVSKNIETVSLQNRLS